jgi:hypothetical protein
MIATQFATELRVSGLRMVGNRISSDDCPGIVRTRGRIDGPVCYEKSSENDEIIVRLARIGMA